MKSISKTAGAWRQPALGGAAAAAAAAVCMGIARSRDNKEEWKATLLH